MKMKYKVLSVILALCLCFGAFPVVAADGATGANDGLHLTKTATKNNDGTYKITLEAFTTGTVTTTTTVKPLDIVLVLDQSGSMNYGFNGEEVDNKNKSRQYATVNAAKTFIDSVAGSSEQHRIAIVRFGDKSNTGTLKELTHTDSNGATGLKNSLNGLTPSGYTPASKGLNMAYEAFGFNNANDRKKIVIFFTDGSPSSGDGHDFQLEEADKAIEEAHKLKDKGVEVYSVGMFSDPQINTDMISADPAETNVGNWWPFLGIDGGEAAMNRYMNFISSNSLEASSLGLKAHRSTFYNDGWEITAKPNWSDKGYYLEASSAINLNIVFENISSSVITPSISLGTETMLKDVISDYFTLPEGAKEDDITVQTADIKSIKRTGKYAWKDPIGSSLSATISGKNISVKGFNYDENVVVKNGNAVSGKKLIVSFNVNPIEGFLGGNQVPTNDIESGIYSSTGEIVKEFDVPTVDVPINYTPTADDITIYRGNSFEISDVTSTANLGLLDDYVTITRALNSADTSPTACTDYTLNWTVAPNETGAVSTENGSVPFTVHVLQPTLEVTDSYVDYGFDVDMKEQNVTTLDYATACSDSGSSITVIGTKPALTVKFKQGATETDPTFTANLTNADKEYNATVLIDGVDTEIAKEFKVNLNRYDITITKTVNKDHLAKHPQTFIFDVGNEVTGMTVTISPKELANGSCTKTIKGFYAGTDTTVTEKIDWSWRYSPRQNEPQTVRVMTGADGIVYAKPETPTKDVEFSNALNNIGDKWWNEDTFVRNVFNGTTITQGEVN